MIQIANLDRKGSVMIVISAVINAYLYYVMFSVDFWGLDKRTPVGRMVFWYCYLIQNLNKYVIYSAQIEQYIQYVIIIIIDLLLSKYFSRFYFGW